MIRSNAFPVLLAVAVLPSLAQDRNPLATTYKVEFHIRDGSDASAKGGRRYTIWIDALGQGSFHLDDRVPVTTGFSPGGGPAQFTYYDTGVSIDTKLYEQDTKVGLNGTIDMTVLSHRADGAATSNPTVSHIKLSIHAMVTPNKPSLVASIDDPVAPRKFDVEALVTKVD